MIEYVLAVSVSFLFSAIYDLWKNERLTERRTRGGHGIGLLLVVLAALPYFYFQAGRNELGVDYPLYEREFFYINYDYGWVHSDVGFRELNRVVFLLGGNAKTMFAVVALIQTIGVYALAVVVDIPLSAFSLLYFLTFNYLQSYSLIAQYTAIGLVSLAFALMFKKHHVLSLVLLLAAATVHSSSVIFIVLFIWYIVFLQVDKKRRFILFSFGLAALLGVLAPAVAPLVLRHTRFYAYFSLNFSFLNSTSMIIINIAVVALMLLVERFSGCAQSSELFAFFSFLMFLALTISLLQPVIPLMVRFAMYFSFFSVYAIPIALKEIPSNKVQKCMYVAVLFLYLVWLIEFPIAGNYYQVIPYR